MTAYSNRELNHDLSQCLPKCEKSVINPFKRLVKVVKLWIMRFHERKQLAKLDGRMLKILEFRLLMQKEKLHNHFGNSLSKYMPYKK